MPGDSAAVPRSLNPVEFPSPFQSASPPPSPYPHTSQWLSGKPPESDGTVSFNQWKMMTQPAEAGRQIQAMRPFEQGSPFSRVTPTAAMIKELSPQPGSDTQSRMVGNRLTNPTQMAKEQAEIAKQQAIKAAAAKKAKPAPAPVPTAAQMPGVPNQLKSGQTPVNYAQKVTQPVTGTPTREQAGYVGPDGRWVKGTDLRYTGYYVDRYGRAYADGEIDPNFATYVDPLPSPYDPKHSRYFYGKDGQPG